MTKGSAAKTKRYMLLCPRCGKRHYSDGAIFDDRVSCSCGFDFYAFAADDLRIIMPWAEAKYEPILRAMRKLVVTTGRCTDIPPELYEDYGSNYPDLEVTLDRALKEHQTDAFGTCYISAEQLDLICEILEKNYDVELKCKKGHLEIRESRMKTVRSKDDESKSTSGAAGSKELTRILPGAGLMFSSQPVNNNRI